MPAYLHIRRAIRAAHRPSLVAMTEARRRIGRAAEQIVAARLIAAGWELVGRNARTRYGELDIIALDGVDLVFVEVKAGREGTSFGPERPVHAVGPRKQRQVRRLATAWLAERRGRCPRYAEIRFDAVGVSFDRQGRVADVEHIEGAF
jgi:putative endonuclease